MARDVTVRRMGRAAFCSSGVHSPQLLKSHFSLASATIPSLCPPHACHFGCRLFILPGHRILIRPQSNGGIVSEMSKDAYGVIQSLCPGASLPGQAKCTLEIREILGNEIWAKCIHSWLSKGRFLTIPLFKYKFPHEVYLRIKRVPHQRGQQYWPGMWSTTIKPWMGTFLSLRATSHGRPYSRGHMQDKRQM